MIFMMHAGPWLSTRSLDCPLCKQPAILDGQTEVFERLFGDIVVVVARQWQVCVLHICAYVCVCLDILNLIIAQGFGDYLSVIDGCRHLCVFDSHGGAK